MARYVSLRPRATIASKMANSKALPSGHVHTAHLFRGGTVSKYASARSTDIAGTPVPLDLPAPWERAAGIPPLYALPLVFALILKLFY